MSNGGPVIQQGAVNACTCGNPAYLDWFINRERITECFVRCTNSQCPNPIGPVRLTDQEAIQAWNNAEG